LASSQASCLSFSWASHSEILLGAGKRFRVLDVVPFEEEDESPLVGLLQVEAA
jgi:hypothetical protein